MSDPIRAAADGSVAKELAKFEAAGKLESWRCRHCSGRAVPVEMAHGPVPFGVEYRHEDGCPADGWDGPAVEALTYE